MRIKICFLVLSLALAQLVAPAASHAAQIYLLDDFNDGVLDPKWNVTFTNNANGSWLYNESGGSLNVTGIGYRYPTPWNSAGNDWAWVNLTQYFNPVDDFKVDFSYSWVSGILDMDLVYIRLLDQSGSQVALGGFCDAWIGGYGRYYLAGGSTIQRFAASSQGSKSTTIERSNGVMNFLLNKVLSLSVANDTLISGIQIQFAYYPYPGSTFGKMSVDFVSLEGTPANSPSPTPEPASLALMASGLGAAGLWLSRRRARQGLSLA